MRRLPLFETSEVEDQAGMAGGDHVMAHLVEGAVGRGGSADVTLAALGGADVRVGEIDHTEGVAPCLPAGQRVGDKPVTSGSVA